jgi:hypothetical protein
VWNSPDEVNVDALPKNFAMKASHGSGGILLVWDGAPLENSLPENIESVEWNRFLINPKLLEPKSIEALGRRWFSLNYYRDTGYFEWCYKKVQPRVLIQELLLGPDELLPKDYKFFMIHGKCRMIQVDITRYEGHRRNLYDAEWNLLPCQSYAPPALENIPEPENLSEMIDLAERLSEGMDFIRVDLYMTAEGIKFGELTNYPLAAADYFRPREFDYWLGSFWNHRRAWRLS